MSNESLRIADQLKRAFDGDAWHGPSLDEALAGVTVEQAVARPIAGAHSIWEIVSHIAGWDGVVTRRLGGEALPEPPEGDFPPAPPDATEGSWASLIHRASDAHDRLATDVASLSEADLERRVQRKPYPAWAMVHGAVGHALYHVGQIVLLKKALAS